MSDVHHGESVLWRIGCPMSEAPRHKPKCGKADMLKIISAVEHKCSATVRDFQEGSTTCGVELFQSNLAHELVAHDFADFQTLDCQLALLGFVAHDLVEQRLRFFA